ncbi:MAG: hypothetical protein WD135_02380, partial [Ferruginibacter sp.]
MRNILFVALLLICSCAAPRKTSNVPVWQPYDETQEVAKANQDNKRLRYKMIQSKLLDKNT